MIRTPTCARSVLPLGLAAVLVSTSTFSVRADDKPLLIELETRSESLPGAVSASGAVVVGSLNGTGAFYWMPTTGVISAGGLAANNVSRDGNAIVGLARDARGIQQAAMWIRAAEWRLLGSFPGSAGPCDAFLSSALDVNDDGIVVGYAYSGCAASAFRWQESGGMVNLGSTVPGRSSRGFGVSEDGAVVVGDQTSAEGFNQGARWVGGRQELFTGPEGPAGTAMAANHDGSIIVGRVCVPASGRVGDQSAWVWKSQGGLTCLPAPRRLVSPGPPILVEAAATSDDGQVIGGSQNVGGSPDSNAVIWIGGQPAYLKEFLQANGLPDAFRTWINTGTITGISPDGRILVGWGAALGGFRGYMVILGSSRTIPS